MMLVPSIDVYVTFRCDMRCKHCFMGDLLDKPADLAWDDIDQLIDVAAERWGTSEINFLGGEPTMYPQIERALNKSLESGYHTRIVTNGGRPLSRLLASAAGMRGKLHIAFSVDGSNADEHDSIRKRGSFDSLLQNLAKSSDLGHKRSAILSVGSHNIGSALPTLELLDKQNLEHINVHFVTDRGAAKAEMVSNHESWRRLRRAIHRACLQTPVRFESTFIPRHETVNCLVRNQESLMFFADGRVFSCTMYLHLLSGHEFTWSGGMLHRNEEFNARYGAAVRSAKSCPAAPLVNRGLVAQADKVDLRIGCIFDKKTLAPTPATEIATETIAS